MDKFGASYMLRNGGYVTIKDSLIPALKPLKRKAVKHGKGLKDSYYDVRGDYVFFQAFGVIRAYHLWKIAELAEQQIEFLPTEDGLIVVFDNSVFTLKWQAYDGKGDIVLWELETE